METGGAADGAVAAADGAADGAAASAEGGGAADGGSASRRAYQNRLCAPISKEDDRCTWLVVGPVLSGDRVDPAEFTFSALVVSKPGLSAREVFARAVAPLIKRGKFSSRAEAVHSLRLLARCTPLDDDDGVEEPSWDGLGEDVSDVDCLRVLDRTLRVSGDAVSRRRSDGHVTIQSIGRVRDHPWVKNGVEAQNKRVAKHAVGRAMGTSGFDRLPVLVQRRAVAGEGSGVFFFLRRATEMVDPSSDEEGEEGGPRKRARRRDAGYGQKVPRMLPTSRRVRKIIRQAIDDPTTVPHAMLTLGADSSVRVWRYVLGSATKGARWYVLSDGTRKRLAAPHHRRSRKKGKHDGDGGGELSDAVDAAAVARDPAAELRARLRITRSTYHEDVTDEEELYGGASASGGRHRRGTELVVAVEFDAVHCLRRAFRAAKPLTEAEVQRAPAAVTLAGDGGPVRRTSMTILTLTVSSPLLSSGRTPLIPVLFILGGEQALHSAVGERLRERLIVALKETYMVPIKSADTAAASTPPLSPPHWSPPPRPAAPLPVSPLPVAPLPSLPAHFPVSPPPPWPPPPPPLPPSPSTPHPGSRSGWTFAPFRLPFLLWLCGDFAMISHLLTLTGGGDVNRCPFRWPCLPKGFLSGALLDGEAGCARDGSRLAAHWELVVWSLSRWCTLRRSAWRASGGYIRWACAGCQRDLVALSSSAATLSCPHESCPLFEEPRALLVQPIAYTPLSDVYRLLRRRMGGPRGYPLLGEIPFRIQAPVLHCVGKISKCLMYFLLALLTPSYRDAARQKIYSLLGRSNLGAMYLREFARLGAMVVAAPGVLGDGFDVDSGVVMMLQLSQLLTASWRRAISSQAAVERERAAATLQLSASLLAPLYAALKPFDPETKKAGVFNLYLHTALSHVRQSVGEAFPTLAMICDDNIEGKIAEMNRYFNRRTNNVSSGQSVTNKQALDPLEFNEHNGRSAAEQMLFTTEIVVCPCICRVGASLMDDIKAVVRYASRDRSLSVNVYPSAPLPTTMAVIDAQAAVMAAATAAATAERATEAAAAASVAAGSTVGEGRAAATSAAAVSWAEQSTAGATEAASRAEAALVEIVGMAPLLLLVDSVPDEVRQDKTPNLQKSIEHTMQEELEAAQRRVSVCVCGLMTGAVASDVACKAMAKVVAAQEEALSRSNESSFTAAAAAAVSTTAAAAAPATPTAPATPATAAAAAAAAATKAAAAKTALAVAIQREPDWVAVGEDELLPTDLMPDKEDPVEGDRCYRLDELELTDSDADADADGEDDAGFAVVDPAGSGYGAFMLQAATDEDTIASVLPSADVVDFVLGTTPRVPDTPGTEELCNKLSEDLMMMQLFIERMRGPDFLAWARRDGAILRDMVRAAERLRHTFLSKLIELRGRGSEVATA